MKTAIELQRDVQDEISWEPTLCESEIKVIVHDGIVTLIGSVGNLPAKWRAEKAALRVAGVKAVVNEIEVKLTTENRRSDEDLSLAVVNTLEWNVILPKHLLAMVDDGWVTLSGKVEWHFQRNAATDAVAQLTGVRGISNNIILQPRITPFAVKEKIEAALLRHTTLDACEIHVKTEGGKIRLEGTVGSWMEKEEAENASWSAPGVTHVENQLLIQIKNHSDEVSRMSIKEVK